MKKSVLVGLSGGVDSAAVAKILLDQGYRVFGTYLALCPGADPERARLVAARLGIPFSVVDRRKAFEKKVIRPFVETYREGKTPNPCVECNRHVKIAYLLAEADRLGIPLVATGHYAEIKRTESGRMELYKGKDKNKDQSYFLWKLTQKQLSRILFPLGDREKKEIRLLGEPFVSEKEKESMEICFIPDGDAQGFVSANGGATEPGNFVDAQGNVLGRHKGISHYTIGQRRGLNIAMGQRVFVTALRPEKGEVVIGTEDELLITSLRVEQLHYISALRRDIPKTGVTFKGRNRGAGEPCKLTFDRSGVTVKFDNPLRRFAPGQSACFYEGGCLLFGGVICEEEKLLFSEQKDMCKA